VAYDTWGGSWGSSWGLSWTRATPAPQQPGGGGVAMVRIPAQMRREERHYQTLIVLHPRLRARVVRGRLIAVAGCLHPLGMARAIVSRLSAADVAATPRILAVVMRGRVVAASGRATVRTASRRLARGALVCARAQVRPAGRAALSRSVSTRGAASIRVSAAVTHVDATRVREIDASDLDIVASIVKRSKKQ
jgi:hypothetical protein